LIEQSRHLAAHVGRQADRHVAQLIERLNFGTVLVKSRLRLRRCSRKSREGALGHWDLSGLVLVVFTSRAGLFSSELRAA
jgi:hypothetical protein